LPAELAFLSVGEAFGHHEKNKPPRKSPHRDAIAIREGIEKDI
jgi:hypothetical protein